MQFVMRKYPWKLTPEQRAADRRAFEQTKDRAAAADALASEASLDDVESFLDGDEEQSPKE